MDEGNYQKAIEVFSSGIEQNDIARSANYFGRALSNYEIGKIQEAKSDIEMSLTTESFNNESINSVIYWLKGMIANHEGDKGLKLNLMKKLLNIHLTILNLRPRWVLHSLKMEILKRQLLYCPK